MTRLEFGHRDTARSTAVALGEHFGDGLRTIVPHNFSQAFGKPQRGFHRVGDAATILGAHDQAVDDHRNGVIDSSVELRWIGEFDEFAVDDGAYEALLSRVLEQILELPFSLLHQRRPNFEARALRPGKHHLGDLRGALLLHRAPAVGAMGRTGAGVQQAQVVVHFGHGSHGGTWVVAGRFLFDRDGW